MAMATPNFSAPLALAFLVVASVTSFVNDRVTGDGSRHVEWKRQQLCVRVLDHRMMNELVIGEQYGRKHGKNVVIIEFFLLFFTAPRTSKWSSQKPVQNEGDSTHLQNSITGRERERKKTRDREVVHGFG